MIKEKKTRKQKVKKILKIISLPFIIILMVLAIYVGYCKIIKKENSISLFGYKQYVILTGSMIPSYNVGDLIIDKQINQEEIKINDVISYIEESTGNTITHRVIEIVEQNGKTLYITKGDNNDSPDKDLVKFSQVQGKVIKKISGIGTAILGITTGTGIIIIILIIIFNYIYTNKKEEKQMIREEARKKYNVPKYKKEDSI